MGQLNALQHGSLHLVIRIVCSSVSRRQRSLLVECAAMYGVYLCVYVYMCVCVCNIHYCSKNNASDIARARSREEVMQILFFLFIFVIDSSSSYGLLTWAQIAAAATCVRSNRCLFLLSVSSPIPLTEESDLKEKENIDVKILNFTSGMKSG